MTAVKIPAYEPGILTVKFGILCTEDRNEDLENQNIWL